MIKSQKPLRFLCRNHPPPLPPENGNDEYLQEHDKSSDSEHSHPSATANKAKHSLKIRYVLYNSERKTDIFLRFNFYTIQVRVNEIGCFYLTCNDVSVIYVTAPKCAGGLKKKLDLRSGSQRHSHFVGFFHVPVQAPTR